MKPALTGQTVVVYGLARSGLSAIRLLRREGAKVVAVDQASREQLGQVAASLESQGVLLHLGEDPTRVLREASLVVVSPGVPLNLPELVAAREAGIPIWGEVELASRFLPESSRFVGITGTNGKSTTTALTGALFEAHGRRAFVGGNLGLPLSEAVLDEKPFEVHVVELSSFQLEGAQTVRSHAAVILNVTPDHIDRYADMAAYGEAKRRIFAHQRPDDVAVVNAEDAATVGLASGARAKVYGFTLDPHATRGGPFEGLAVATEDGFRFDVPGLEEERYTVKNRALRGRHNLQNAMAAALLARLSGVSPKALQWGLDGFGGLPHRIESVATVNGVEWVNDSKATNVDSTLVALSAFEGGLWLILGGKGKGAPYAPLVEAANGKVKGILTVGQDASTIEAAFRDTVPVHGCETLARAVATARSKAVAGDVVLLSPACASYDQFKNFEHRGDTFKSLVRELAE